MVPLETQALKLINIYYFKYFSQKLLNTPGIRRSAKKECLNS